MFRDSLGTCEKYFLGSDNPEDMFIGTLRNFQEKFLQFYIVFISKQKRADFSALSPESQIIPLG